MTISPVDIIVNNSKISLSALNETDDILIARIKDCIRFASEKQSKKFIGFLNERELAVAKSIGVGRHCTAHEYGGFDGAERVMIGFYPNGEQADYDDFPITAITVVSGKEADLSHSDYLGSLMALGIERECVGDILCEKGRGVIFLKDSIKDFVLTSLNRVGREGVKCSFGFTLPLPQAHSYKKIRDTVASARLDSVVAALCNLSRAHACEKLKAGIVSLNGLVCEKPTKVVSAGDKITVRGCGKYVIEGIDKLTKKNRLVLEAQKYI